MVRVRSIVFYDIIVVVGSKKYEAGAVALQLWTNQICQVLKHKVRMFERRAMLLLKWRY